MNKAPEPEVKNNLVKLFLNNDEWIEFRTNDWMYSEYIKFSNAVSTVYMAILIDRVNDWKIKDDLSGAYIEFNPTFLKENQEVLNIRGSKQREMVTLYYRAYNMAATLEPEKK